ncbi:MAG: hypothetical protein AB8G26_07330 [Ilumatobacter sp.]
MAETDPLSQMFQLFAAPLSATVQSFDQFRKGVDQFQKGVENFNRTMENLNETAERINVLLAEVEEPLRAAVPQMTRTIKAADEMMNVVAGPAIAVAPGLQVLAETLNTPALKQLPVQLAQMNEVMSDVSSRLAPLGQVAESAGGLFGLKIPGFPSGGSRPAPPQPSQPDPEVEVMSGSEATKIKKTAARKRSAKKKTAARTGGAKKKAAAPSSSAKKKAASTSK